MHALVGPPAIATCSEMHAAAAAAPAEPRLGWYARFKKAAKALKKEVLAVYYAIHDPRTPWYAKLLPFFVLAYALSPLDLIPGALVFQVHLHGTCRFGFGIMR